VGHLALCVFTFMAQLMDQEHIQITVYLQCHISKSLNSCCEANSVWYVCCDYNPKPLLLYSISYVTYVKMPLVSYTLKQMFIYDTYVKNKEEIPTNSNPYNCKWAGSLLNKQKKLIKMLRAH
jgi:hypothetical protein